jgi:hypothetical protein
MAAAKLDFKNGYMAIERCENADKPGEQFLMAHVYSKSRGVRTSAPVSVKEAVAFATSLVRQALLSDGHHEDELEDMAWISRKAKISQ